MWLNGHRKYSRLSYVINNYTHSNIFVTIEFQR